MLYFPQLASGAVGQYPISKHCIQRTILNTLPDGRTFKYADPGAPMVQWQLRFHELADSEIAVLEQFFAACEGRLNTFTFTDPLSNLLAWSEALTQPTWQSNGLQFTGGVPDPNGGTSATQIANPTGTDLTIEQTIGAPGWYLYCFSAYVQSPAAMTTSLFRRAGGFSDTRPYPTTTSWQRISFRGRTNTAAESVAAGIIIPAGQSLNVFGPQLEPQPAASPYKPSYSAGGVYRNAHFGEDTIAVTATAPNRNQCTLTITAH